MPYNYHSPPFVTYFYISMLSYPLETTRQAQLPQTSRPPPTHQRPSLLQPPPRRNSRRASTSSSRKKARCEAMTSTTTTVSSTMASHADTRTAHKLLQPEIPPHGLPARRGRGVHGLRDPERGVLVRNDIVLVFRVERLVLRRDVDVLDGEERGDHGGWGGGGAVCHCRCGVAAVVLLWVGVVVMGLLGCCRREVRV